MALSAGTRLGAYEIVGAIGAGGMGEVYRGRDTKLDRDVAIKVLPETFAADPERIARFQREAKTLASLNHPHIGAIYGLEESNGIKALVLELVEGPTLADRIAEGPIPLDEALPIAKQIAEALEAAHEHGIIHRDLKPANIKLKSDGTVKVLDFGLAKAVEGAPVRADLTASPTITSPAMTMGGVILGTAAYMSPEQAKGKPVDKRADIWAFGCVLYEMLTGKPAFGGETLTDIVAAVIKNEPDWNALLGATPGPVRLLRRCLQKDPGKRLQHAGDARIEIEEAIAESTSPPTHLSVSPSRSSMARLISLAIAALFAVALLVTLITRGLAPLPSPPVIRLELNMPPGVEAGMTNSPNLAISPDGTRVAFAGVLGGRRLLYVRRFDEFEAVPIKGTETVNVVCFSPDGTALAFISSERVLKTVSLADGLVTPLDSDADYTGGGLAWSAGGLITFGSRGTLWQVPWTGGTRRQLTTLDSKQNERLHAWPTALPNDKAILLTSVTGGERIAMHIESLSLATGERQRVTNNGSSPIYAPSGHLLYFRDGSVLAAPFSLDTLRVTGAAVAVLDNIALDQLGNPLLTLSSAGQLAFIPSGSATKQLVWVSRQGVEQTITDISRPYQNPRLAPDGHRIAVEVAGGDLWMADSTRATFQLLTTKQTAGNTFAVWTPDAKRIVFRTVTGLHWIDPDSGGAAHPIPDTSVSDIPTSISPDSQTLAFIRQSSTTRTAGDIYVLSLNGDPKPHPVVETNGYDGGGQFSPDGNWLAYVSNETGQFEVYVRPFPSAGRRHPVSTQGGTHPRWNRNGKELFYRSGNKMMMVDVTTDTELRISQPRMLFERRYAFGSAQSVPNYDVSPDGQHFLMVKDESSSGRLNVVLNWFEELKRLVPAN